jgi:ferric-chelate reductase
VLSFPVLYRAYRAGRVFTGLFGVREGTPKERDYTPAPPTAGNETVLAKEHRRPLYSPISFPSFLLWSPLGVGLNVGQSTSLKSRPFPVVLTVRALVTVVVLYFAIIIICTLTQAPLIDNPNRAGIRSVRI